MDQVLERALEPAPSGPDAARPDPAGANYAH